MKSKYFQVIDGEGFAMPTHTKFKLACCDCNLVHEVVIVASRTRKEVGIAMRRDNRATAAKRRKHRKK